MGLLVFGRCVITCIPFVPLFWTMEKHYFTVKEIATYLGLSPNTIRAWVKYGRIPFCKFGRAVRFDIKKIEPWVRKHEYQP